MENNKIKRYLVTYTDSKITAIAARDLLAVDSIKFKEGVAFLTSGSVPGKDDVLHFENLGISSLALTLDEYNALKLKQGILTVEEDKEMHVEGYISENQESIVKTVKDTKWGDILWNMDLVKAPAAWEKGADGTGINVAILDTGIAKHADLVITGGICMVPGYKGYNDEHGHGTHCAGIACGRGILASNKFNIYGVAKNANLYAVKVINDKGKGEQTWIIAGMEWCVTNKINVVSMSLGDKSSPSAAYATAVKKCQDSDVTVICASGNHFKSLFPWVNSPANSFAIGMKNEKPIAVGAIDEKSDIADFSSRGGENADWNQVIVVAPGVDIYSTYLNDSYIKMSGTSMACPHVAGMAALLYQKFPGIKPGAVMEKISVTAHNLGAKPFPNTAYGLGLIDCAEPIK